MRVISITGRIPPMKHELVAVGILEERHVTHARVEDVTLEHDSARLELAARLGHVGYAQRDMCRVRTAERRADLLEVDEVHADVLAELELRPRARTGDLRQAERLL